MAIEKDANTACLNISETECNRKRAQTWGIGKLPTQMLVLICIQLQEHLIQASGFAHFRNRKLSFRSVFQFWGSVQASCTGDLGQDTLKRLTLHLTYHVLDRTWPFYVFQPVWTESFVSSLGRCLINESAFYSNRWITVNEWFVLLGNTKNYLCSSTSVKTLSSCFVWAVKYCGHEK